MEVAVCPSLVVAEAVKYLVASRSVELERAEVVASVAYMEKQELLLALKL